MSITFSPLSIRSVSLKNRLVVSPMCMYSSVDGFANDWHLVHLGSRAVGGAGIVMQEATAVSPEGRITPHCLGIWKDEHIDYLKRIVDFIHQNGSVAAIQLAHAGRKASTHQLKQLTIENGGWETVAPSGIPFNETERNPIELDKKGILKVIDDFRSATLRSIEIGYKTIEIHVAHGYLLHQFLSPLSNLRTDEYGGSFENRIRIVLEVVREVRKIWSENLPLFVRISATDWASGGWDIEDSIKLAKILKNEGVDLIDCSSGGLSLQQKIVIAPLYQVPFSEKIRKETDIKTAAVGLITTHKEVESILENHQADLVFMAREFLRNPYLPMHFAHQMGEDIDFPQQYLRAKPAK